MAPCRAMICHQVTLSGDAEWPKVADAVIEAENPQRSYEVFEKKHYMECTTLDEAFRLGVVVRVAASSPLYPYNAVYS